MLRKWAQNVLLLFLKKFKSKNKEDIKMTRIYFNPGRLSGSADDNLDSMIESVFHGPVIRRRNFSEFIPAVDVTENKGDLIMIFEIPGVEKSDIKVVIENETLTISGNRKPLYNNKDANQLRREVCYGSFSRSFSLPERVDPGKVEADYRNGVLKIVLHKTEAARPEEISINVN
jgi:HSP20 family protein